MLSRQPPSTPERFRLRDYGALDHRVLVLAGTRAINTAGLSLSMAFMAIYLVGERGLAGTAYGLLFLVANLCASYAQAHFGALSDHVGRRPVMIGAMWARSLMLTLLGAEILYESSILIIAPTLIVSSTLRGIFEPVAYAAVADVAKPEQRVAAYGLQRMGTNLGWALGPAAGGALAQVMPYGAVFFCSAGALVAASIAVAAIREPRSHTPRAKRSSTAVREAIADARRHPAIVVLLGCVFLAGVVHLQLFSTLSIYAHAIGLDNAEVGLGYTVNGVLVLALQLPAIAVIERITARRALVSGGVLYIFGFVALAFSGDLVGVALGIAILTCGEVLQAPAQQAVIAELSDPRRIGRAFGLFGLMSSAGVAIAPLFGGAAYDLLGAEGGQMWLALAVLPLALVVGFLRFSRLRAPAAGTF